ncbi:YesL family protein [Micromonospora sp. NPDC048830]|uniref:YesL family protein n=1 Tax=Micromonospora sp. NPDC048830 TaxID=3364257 RepID=UPI003714F181
MTSPDVPVGGRFARLYRLPDWPPRLAGLNLLWLAGVLAGGVVAGLSPATVALFALLRDYQRGRQPRPWRDFWRHWRAEFGRSQVRLGVPVLTVWVFAFYLLAARRTPLAAAVAVLALGYLAVLAYLPAVLAHFAVPATTAWRIAALTAARAPLRTLGLGATVALLVVAMLVAVPVAVPFFLPSAPAALITLVATRIFDALPAPAAGGGPKAD